MPELRWGRHAVRLKLHNWVGTDPSCNVRIDDPSVAERHGLIMLTRGGWYYVDYRTGGRSSLNGSRCDLPVRLLDGDCITAGRTGLTFEFLEGEPPPRPAEEAPPLEPSAALADAHRLLLAMRALGEPDRAGVAAFLDFLSERLDGAKVQLFLAGTALESEGACPGASLPEPGFTQSRGGRARLAFLPATTGAPALALIDVPLASLAGRGLLRALRPEAFDRQDLLALTVAATGLQARLGHRPLKE